jgi:hypothetical protein
MPDQDDQNPTYNSRQQLGNVYGSPWPFAGYDTSSYGAALAALLMYSWYSNQVDREVGGLVFLDTTTGLYGFTIGTVGPVPMPWLAQVDAATLFSQYSAPTRVFVGVWHTHVNLPGSKMGAEAAANPAATGFSADVDTRAFQTAAYEYVEGMNNRRGGPGPQDFVFLVSTPQGYIGIMQLALDRNGRPLSLDFAPSRRRAAWRRDRFSR